MRKAWVIGTFAFGALATALVATNVARTIGQLHAFASAVATLARSQLSDHDASRSTLDIAKSTAAAAMPASPLPTADPTPVPHPGYRLPERRAGFDADAMRAAIAAEPSIDELINDPDPKVRAAILAFFENE